MKYAVTILWLFVPILQMNTCAHGYKINKPLQSRFIDLSAHACTTKTKTNISCFDLLVE